MLWNIGPDMEAIGLFTRIQTERWITMIIWVFVSSSISRTVRDSGGNMTLYSEPGDTIKTQPLSITTVATMRVTSVHLL